MAFFGECVRRSGWFGRELLGGSESNLLTEELLGLSEKLVDIHSNRETKSCLNCVTNPADGLLLHVPYLVLYTLKLDFPGIRLNQLTKLLVQEP